MIPNANNKGNKILIGFIFLLISFGKYSFINFFGVLGFLTIV